MGRASFDFEDETVVVTGGSSGIGRAIALEFGEAGAEQKEETVAADGLTKPIPLDRPGYPEDIAPTTLFLASEQADYVTGEMVYVDGGWQTF